MKLPRARALKLGTAAEVEARQIPPLVRWSIRIGTLRAQVSWLLAVIGLVICIAVLPRITGYPHYTEHASAMIVDTDGADAVYQYADHARRDHVGHAPLHGATHIGEVIDIWYDAHEPGLSSPIEGYEADHPGPGSYALLAWPGIAIVLAGLFMWRPRVMRLLRHGRETRMRPIKNGDAFVITFDYVTDAGQHKTGQIPALRSYVEPEKLALMYAPWNPDFAMVLEELPGRPRLVDGRFVATVRPFGLWILPAATVAAGVLLAVACIR